MGFIGSASQLGGSGGGGGSSTITNLLGITSSGQAVSALSLPVVLASDQSSIPVTTTISGVATSANQTNKSQITQIADGSGNIIGSTSNALNINISSGNPTSITANAGTNLNTSALATSANQTNASQKTQIVDGSGNVIGSSSNALNINTSLMGGNSVLTGSGAVGTGAQRVVLSNDYSSTTLAQLSNGTNQVTVMSNTATSKYGLDTNIISILGTAPTTAGFIDVKGADGNVFVRQATAANLNATVSIASAQTLATVTNVAELNGVGPTFNSTTYTSKQGLDNNILGVLGTAFTTAGFVNVQGTSSGAAVTSYPVTAGGQAITSLPTANTATYNTPVSTDKFGRMIVLPNAMRDIVGVAAQLVLTASTTETSFIAAISNVSIDLLWVVCINTGASATEVDFRDSTGGTIRLSLYVPAGDTRGIVFQTPLPQATAHNAWTAQCGASTSSLIVTGAYVQNK